MRHTPRIILILLLGLMVQSAKAAPDFLTRLADINDGVSGDLTGSVTAFSQLQGTKFGISVTNQIEAGGPGTGNTIISFAATRITQYVNSSGFTVNLPYSQDILAVFVGKGGLTVGAGVSTAKFTEGTIGLYTVPSTTPFSGTDITTYGYDQSKLIATFDVTEQANIVKGQTGAFGSGTVGSLVDAAGFTNIFALNINDPTSTTGKVLFQDKDDDFIQVDKTGLEAGGKYHREGIGGLITEFASLGSSGSGAVSASELTLLNTIADELGGFSDLAGAGTAFADGFGSGVNQFSNDLGSFQTTGDIQLQVTSFNVVPGVQAVPEPTSIIAWLGILMVGYIVRRRRKK